MVAKEWCSVCLSAKQPIYYGGCTQCRIIYSDVEVPIGVLGETVTEGEYHAWHGVGAWCAVPCPICGAECPRSNVAILTAAARLAIRRKLRNERPWGKRDSAGRWYPHEWEEADCCMRIRYPSRAWPNSLYHHCRSYSHIANRFGVDKEKMMVYVKALSNGELDYDNT